MGYVRNESLRVICLSLSCSNPSFASRSLERRQTTLVLVMDEHMYVLLGGIDDGDDYNYGVQFTEQRTLYVPTTKCTFNDE